MCNDVDDGTDGPTLNLFATAASGFFGDATEALSALAVERFLLKINRQLGRGSEQRFVSELLANAKEPKLRRGDFHALYASELAEGKFWGVEHDLRELRGRP